MEITLEELMDTLSSREREKFPELIGINIFDLTPLDIISVLNTMTQAATPELSDEERDKLLAVMVVAFGDTMEEMPTAGIILLLIKGIEFGREIERRAKDKNNAQA